MSETFTPNSSVELEENLRATTDRISIRGNGNHSLFFPETNPRIISTKSLDKILFHSPSDLIITVQSGITIGSLNNELKKYNQWLPLDVDPQATIGGIVARDLRGASELAHKRVRDWLVGCKIILSDGQLVQVGSTVVKNVAGYAVEKLMIGSLGTLGIITEATFKLLPLPEERETFTAECGRHEIFSVAEGLRTTLRPAAMTVSIPTREKPDSWPLSIQLEGFREDVRSDKKKLESVVSFVNGKSVATSLPVTLFISHLHSHTSEIMMWLRTHLHPDMAKSYFGTGNLIVGFANEPDLELVKELHNNIIAFSGRLVVEKGSQTFVKEINNFITDKNMSSIRSAIKKVFDPGERLPSIQVNKLP